MKILLFFRFVDMKENYILNKRRKKNLFCIANERNGKKNVELYFEKNEEKLKPNLMERKCN